ncbi:hypothetical protein NMY22_g203 [Coprinellus aureogranulatus]|nr:hypothetical protein NMY22_g203 [Coprinellus aureogranulatus]
MLLEGCDGPEALRIVRDAPSERIELLAIQLPAEKMPNDYLEKLEERERVFSLRVCILVWIASEETIIPKPGQLELVLCFLYDRNSILVAGTCFGKTLTIIIAILLEDPADGTVTLVISPLKRLQKTQRDAMAKFGIPTLAINEDERLSDKQFNARMKAD